MQPLLQRHVLNESFHHDRNKCKLYKAVKNTMYLSLVEVQLELVVHLIPLQEV